MASLSDQDRATIAQLRQNGKLTDITAGSFEQTNGVIALFCGDGDQSHDLLSHLFDLQKEARETPRVHCFSCNGGPLRLSPTFPDTDGNLPDFCVAEIQAGKKLKNINTVLLIGHAPCGMAGLQGMNVRQTLKEYAAAAAYLKEKLPNTLVVPLLHVDYGNGKKRTYGLTLSDRPVPKSNLVSD